MNTSFDTAIVQAGPAAHAIADGVQKASLALFNAARGRPIAAAATLCVGAVALYGTSKLIQVATPTAKNVVGVTALTIRFGYDSANSTVRGWFSSTQTA